MLLTSTYGYNSYSLSWEEGQVSLCYLARTQLAVKQRSFAFVPDT